MHFYKTPALVQRLMPGLVWKINTTHKEIFLTFDDGPVAGVTEWVLNTLSEFNAKATFFVVGENVRNNKGIYSRILEEGHTVGNHTYNHLNSWYHKKDKYLENIRLCNEVMNLDNGVQLFRPPHGKLTPGLISELKRDHSIIMWDVLTGDFDASISDQECLDRSLECTSAGSIVVFHDSFKSEKKLKLVLPRYIKELSLKGYSFNSLGAV